jgi:hypothetical protein
MPLFIGSKLKLREQPRSRVYHLIEHLKVLVETSNQTKVGLLGTKVIVLSTVQCCNYLELNDNQMAIPKGANIYGPLTKK